MTPEEKTKAMKLHLSSMYGKMVNEPLYADTDSIRLKGTTYDIIPAIEVLKEMKETSSERTSPSFGRCTVLHYSKRKFDTFCDALIEILTDAERKLNS